MSYIYIPITITIYAQHTHLTNTRTHLLRLPPQHRSSDMGGVLFAQFCLHAASIIIIANESQTTVQLILDDGG